MSELVQILAILNRIEGKVDATNDRLTKHMEEEEDEIEEVKNTIEQYRKESEARHSNLIQSINSYMDKTADLHEAFIKTPEGKPDLHGHRDDHHARKQFAGKVEKWRDEAVGNVVKVTTLGALIWLFYAVWDALLRGPK